MRAVNVSADYCYLYEELRYSSWKVGNFWSQKYNVSDAEKKKNGTYKSNMKSISWDQIFAIRHPFDCDDT